MVIHIMQSHQISSVLLKKFTQRQVNEAHIEIAFKKLYQFVYINSYSIRCSSKIKELPKKSIMIKCSVANLHPHHFALDKTILSAW